MATACGCHGWNISCCGSELCRQCLLHIPPRWEKARRSAMAGYLRHLPHLCCGVAPLLHGSDGA
ncbi:MAG TPA: hypothetical protein DCL04_02805, partial [Synergistaceae bacterium]|nr:hypothetical protein [Synergistaceae bacterium]